MPRCDHAAFRVADLDRSIAFYERMLPARLVERTRHRDRWRTEIATLEPVGDPGFRLVLLHPRRVAWLLRLFHRLVPRQTRSHEHLGFACASREELLERLATARELGLTVQEEPLAVAGGTALLLEVHDPDRNAVEWTLGTVHR